MQAFRALFFFPLIAVIASNTASGQNPTQPHADTTALPKVLQPNPTTTAAAAPIGDKRKASVPIYVVEYELNIDPHDKGGTDTTPWLRIVVSESKTSLTNSHTYFLPRFLPLADIDNVGNNTYAIPYQTAAAGMVALLREAMLTGTRVIIETLPGSAYASNLPKDVEVIRSVKVTSLPAGVHSILPK